MEVNEFRVRAVKRYIVTHYYESEGGRTGGCSTIGTFENLDNADAVGRALAGTVPGATFATIEDRREPVAVVEAFTSEQATALMRFIQSDAYPRDNGR